MNVRAYYEENKLSLTIEDDGVHTDQLEAAYYENRDGVFVKEYSGEFPNVTKIIENFSRLMPGAFSEGDWAHALLEFARICKENKITWYITGSACDAVRGIEVVPHDLDIEIFSEHWQQAQDAFSDYIVEPFIETKGWARDNFGRVVVANMLVDVVADSRYDFPEYAYEPFEWKGYTLWLEPFKNRFDTEIQRNRVDRIAAFERFLEKNM